MCFYIYMLLYIYRMSWICPEVVFSAWESSKFFTVICEMVLDVKVIAGVYSHECLFILDTGSQSRKLMTHDKRKLPLP